MMQFNPLLYNILIIGPYCGYNRKILILSLSEEKEWKMSQIYSKYRSRNEIAKENSEQTPDARTKHNQKQLISHW